MALSTRVKLVQFAVKESILKQEFGDIRSILDELLHTPLWSEQVAMTIHLNNICYGALFSYDHLDGWTYTEEGA